MKIDVLDRGWVELQDMMGDDLSIVNAARVSYLNDSGGEEEDKRLLFHLVQKRHTTPFEQVEFKFRVKAPVLVWWQWVRHRTWSYNAQSGRYIDFEKDDFYLPTEWRKQASFNKQGSDGLVNESISKYTSDVLENVYKKSFEYYQTALKSGIAKEQARLFLPAWGLYYVWVCKVDAHNLMHFLKLRMSKNAQYEIGQYALAIYEIFKEKLPWTAEAFECYIL